jgi:hypothetical protein
VGVNSVSGSGEFTWYSITNSTERMRLTSTGELLINTTSDVGDFKLQVYGNTYVSGSMGIGTSTPSGILDVNGGYANFLASGSIALRIGADGSNDIYMPTGRNLNITAEDNLVFRTSGALTERMRITSGGELLINTTSDAGDYKLQVNGGVYMGIPTVFAANYSQIIFSETTGNTNSVIFYDNVSATKTLTFRVNSGSDAMTLAGSGNLTLSGSIKTAAPSAGNAAAWKLGERVASAGVTFNDQQYIQVDIAGTTYYLATVDLPMPEAYPQAISGPSNNYKITPVQVKTTRDAEIEKLRKEIEELKQLIKNK